MLKTAGLFLFSLAVMSSCSNDETEVNNGTSITYDEIEFKFRESENSISQMLGKSLLVEGTINGIQI